MGSFGGVLKGFAQGFEGGYRLGLAGREMNIREYKEGRPPKNETEAIPPIEQGDHKVPVVGGDEADQGVDPTTTGSTSAPLPNAGGKSIGDQMYGYYRSKGLSHAAAAGIAGNLMQESGGDPRVIGGHRRGDNGASAFAAQWQGQRLTNLYKFAGTQTPSLQQQLDFVLEEMNPQSPYADPIAAKAGSSILNAKTYQEATQLFRDHFERPADPADIKPRLNYAGQFADSGGGGEPFSFGDTSSEPVLPDEKEDEYNPSSSVSGDEDEDSAFTPIEAVPLPEVQMTQLSNWQDFAKPVWQDPTLYAAAGGVIPDEFNKDRAFTQLNSTTASGSPSSGGFSSSAARRVGGGGSWTPRAVGQAGAPTMAAGPTPSQLAFRNLPKYQAPAPVAAPVVAKQPFQVTDAVRNLARAKAQQPSSKGHELRQQREIANWQRIVDQERRAAQGFAGGGKVPSKLEEGTRRERTMSGRGDEAGQSARDRAARRVNVGASGRSSTAIDSDGYWKKGNTTRKKDTALRRAKGGKSAKPKSDTKPKAEPKKKTEFSPDLAVSPNRPDNKPATNAPTNNPPYSPRGPSSIQQQVYAPPPPGSAEIYGSPPPMGAGVLPDDLAPSPWRPDNRPTPPAPPIRRPIPNSGSVVGRAPASSGSVGANPADIDMASTRGTGAAGGVQPARPGMSAQPIRPTASVSGRPMDAPPTAPRRLSSRVPIGEQLSGIQPWPTGEINTGMTAPPGPSDMERFRQGEARSQGGGRRSLQDILAEIELLPPEAKQDIITNLRVPAQMPNRQSEFMYAEGGVIPDGPMVSQRALSANYQTPRRRPLAPSALAEGAQGPEGPEQEPDIEPTPKLLSDLGKALDGGIRFLTRTFGLDGGGGVVDTPESGPQRQSGAMRMASGEGRASPEEVQEVYARVDPEGRMSESQKYMTSLAQTMQWYLANGRKDDAEGAAASLMLYGADRFGKYGAMASAAYRQYQQSGDRNALEDTVGYLEKAYQMIPDGGDFDVISIDEETGTLVTVHRDADGNEQQYDISPDQIPALLQQVQGSSGYWRQVAALADPEGTRQRDRHKFEAGQDRLKRGQTLADRDDTRRYETYKTGETRRYNESQDKLKRDQDVQDRKDEIELKKLEADKARGIVLDDRAEARRLELADREAKRLADEAALKEERTYTEGREELKRTQTLDDERRERSQQLEDKLISETYLRTRPEKAGKFDEATVAPLVQKYLAAAANAKENPDAMNQAGTELVDAVMAGGAGLKWLNEQNIWPNSDFTYLGAPGGGAEMPPEGAPEGTQRMLSPDGQPIWAHPDETSPTGWSEWTP